MTYKEALREIKYQEDLRGKGIDYRVNNLVVAKIVDSLEKQLSKPPVCEPVDSEYENYRCPCCNTNIAVKWCGTWMLSRLLKHCEHCGQALDWSDTE